MWWLIALPFIIIILLYGYEYIRQLITPKPAPSPPPTPPPETAPQTPPSQPPATQPPTQVQTPPPQEQTSQPDVKPQPQPSPPKLASLGLSVDKVCIEDYGEFNVYARAYDTSNNPLPDIVVVLYSGNNPIGQSKTDKDGIAQFKVPCNANNPYQTDLIAVNPDTNIKSNSVTIRCVKSPECSPPSPDKPIQPQPQPIPKRPCCYDSQCWGEYLGDEERDIDPNNQLDVNMLRSVGYSDVEIREIANEKLMKIRYAKCRDQYGNIIPDMIQLKEVKIFSFVKEVAGIVWLWIKTDLDCKNVECLAFWNDSYAYPLKYYADKDAYKYFVQYPAEKKLIGTKTDNQVVWTEEKVIDKPSRVCGRLRVQQQAPPYQGRVKDLCVDTSLTELTVEL